MLVGWSVLDTEPRVIVPVIEKVAGNLIPGFVRHGSLASDIEPEVAGKEAIGPRGNRFICD